MEKNGVRLTKIIVCLAIFSFLGSLLYLQEANARIFGGRLQSRWNSGKGIIGRRRARKGGGGSCGGGAPSSASSAQSKARTGAGQAAPTQSSSSIGGLRVSNGSSRSRISATATAGRGAPTGYRQSVNYHNRGDTPTGLVVNPGKNGSAQYRISANKSGGYISQGGLSSVLKGKDSATVQLVYRSNKPGSKDVTTMPYTAKSSEIQRFAGSFNATAIDKSIFSTKDTYSAMTWTGPSTNLVKDGTGTLIGNIDNMTLGKLFNHAGGDSITINGIAVKRTTGDNMVAKFGSMWKLLGGSVNSNTTIAKTLTKFKRILNQ